MKRRQADGHLTPDEIAALMAGLDEQGSREHAQGCGRCGAELSALQAAVLSVRDSGRDWAERAAVSPRWSRVSESPWSFWSRALTPQRLVLASVLVAGLAGMEAWREYRIHADSEAAAAEVSDAALLAQVDLQISRAVPAEMEPLATLVSWSPSSPAEAARQ